MSGEPLPPGPGSHPDGPRGLHSGRPERTVALASGPDGVVARSVRSLAALPAELPSYAPVGGLAVMVRLSEAHRVTTDFDHASAGPDQAIALLVARGARRTSNGVEIPDEGVRLDLLDATASLPDLADLWPSIESDDEQRGWQLAAACRYALDTAVDTDILVIDPTAPGNGSGAAAAGVGHAATGGAGVVAGVVLPVASAGALVALKAHAMVAPDRDPDKAAADIYDTWRLVRAWGPGVIAEDLARAPAPMLDTTRAQLRSVYVDDVERSAHRLVRASVPGVRAVDVDDLEAVGVVVDAITPFLTWDQARPEP